MVLAPSISTLPKLNLKPGRWTVGSAATCSYRLVGDGVCPRHALLLCGGQNTVLKAWDARTWHNGQVVQGEVRLTPGDRVTLGSVEFTIELDDAVDASESAREVAAVPPISHPERQSRATEIDLAKVGPDGWDLERLREQIQELRDELSHRVSQRSEAVQAKPTESVPDREALEKSAARIAELEQAATEARRLAELAQNELAAAKEESAQRASELKQLADDLRPALDSSRQAAAELQLELNQLRSEIDQREQNWEQQSATWAVEREQWQTKLSALADAQQRVMESEQRQSALFEETTRWKSECEQLRADFQLQLSNWAVERQLLQTKLESLSDAQKQVEEFEQRQSELLSETAQWKSECEQLRAGWELQQSAWNDERKHLQDESRRQEDAIQATLQAVTLREQEWAEQSQQLLAERQKFESERHQLQTEQLEREQVIEELIAERQRVEQQAAETSVKLAKLSERMREFESQQAHLVREQQTLEHSWNWLNTDRRTLVEEKENWQRQRAEWQVEHERWIADSQQLQRDREEFAKTQNLWHEQHAATKQLAANVEELAAERKQFQDEQSAWKARCDQWEADRETTFAAAQASRFEIERQQRVPDNEQETLPSRQLEQEDRPAYPSLGQFVSAVPSTSTSYETPTDADNRSSSDNRSATVDDHDWKYTAASFNPSATVESAVADEPLTALSDNWSAGVDLTEQREAHAKEWNMACQTDLDATTPASMDSIDDEAVLADRMYQDEFSSDSHSVEESYRSYSNDVEFRSAEVNSVSGDDRSESLRPLPAEDHSESDENPDLELMALRARLAARDPTESPVPTEAFRTPEIVAPPNDASPGPVPTSGPVVSILESMAFAEDEDIDDSVSRYMQHLLARSQQPGDAEPDRYIPTSKSKSSTTARSTTSSTDRSAVPDTKSPPPRDQIDRQNKFVAEMDENSSKGESSGAVLMPVHQQDKNAIRTATEQMRQVANQQTVKNVEAANWKQIKRSIKTKTVLASISFVLSAGLLFWGYYFRPEFLILGACASGLGIMTWLDLILAIRQAHARTSRLTGRSKKTNSSKS